MKIIVFEDCKAGTHEYYVGTEKDIMKIFRSNVNQEVWDIIVRLVGDYYQIEKEATQDIRPDEIEYWMLEKANLGYVEEHDIAIYCDEPITEPQESWMVKLPPRPDGESSLKDFVNKQE